MRDAANDAKDLLRWTISRGGQVSVVDLKNPAAKSPAMALCVYDASAAPQPLLAGVILPGGTCAARSCWRALARSGGYVYKNESGTPDGLTGLRLKVTGAGGLQLAVKGKGANLPMPALDLTPPVTAQLVIADDAGTTCWQARFTSSQRNDAGMFRATVP